MRKSQWTAESKHVLITGASSGIGAELARSFARQGAELALIARGKTGSLQDVAEECRTLGSPRAETFVCDMTDSSQIRSAVDVAVEQFGRFDVVICNAGQSMGCYFEEIRDTEQIDYMLSLNVGGVIKTVHHVLPAVPKIPSSRLVIISSVSGLLGVPYRTVYCASKHALTGFANSLRCELRDTYGKSSPAVCLINFPEVSGTKLNTGRMDMGAKRPPAEFDTSSESGTSSVEEACGLAISAIAAGKRESGHPRKIGILLPLYRIIPNVLDGIIMKAVRKNHHRPDEK